jgi:glycosyltransferase involved in cell wall biosynthesis
MLPISLSIPGASFLPAPSSRLILIDHGSDMISFLFIDTERVWRGGQDQLLSLILGLYRRGHRVHLACYPGTLLERRARDAGIFINPFSMRSEIGPFALCSLASILWKVRPDILAFNTPKPILLGSLVSHIIPVRARIIFRRVSFPLRKNLFTRLKYNWGIHRIIAISESIRCQLYSDGVPLSHIKTIYEGLDISGFTQRRAPRTRPSDDPIAIGCVAHLSPEKGVDYLIHAASLIPDVRTRARFIIVGDGKCRQDLEKQARGLGLEDCFQFAGFQDQTSAFLRSFDIFVLPSLSEGLSSAILSAMASSLPVVATRVGGIPELIRNEEEGLLVPPGDPAALAEALGRLCNDPEARLLMGRKGRARVEKFFTLQRKILETEKICESLIRESA